MENLKSRNGSQVVLPITLASELLIEIVNLNLRIKSVLVGMDYGHFLLVKLSQHDLMGTFRSDTVRESQVVVRYLFQGVVYGFNAEILNIVSAPAKLMFVSYPKKIEESKALASTRHECRLPAVTMLGNDFVDMVILDISKEGCQCAIKVPEKNQVFYNQIQVGKTLDIKAELPGTQERLSISGKVRNVSKDVDNILVGVKFDEPAPEAQAKLEKFISLIL